MWVILLIALLLCFVINPILGIVIVVLGILGFFGLIFLMCLADTKKKNLDDTLNGYKFWRLGKVYTCSLSVSGDKGFEACKIALGKRGVGELNRENPWVFGCHLNRYFIYFLYIKKIYIQIRF